MSRTIFNISHGVLTKLISVLISLFVVPIIFANIGADNYGWIGIYSMLLGSLYIFDLGLSNIVTKELTQAKHSMNDKKTIFRSLELVYYLIGLFLLTFLYFSAPLIAKFWLSTSPAQFENSVLLLRLIAIGLFVQWPHSFYTSALFGVHQQVRSNNIQLFISIIKNLTLIILFHLRLISIVEFFYFQIFISILTTVVLRLYISKELNSTLSTGLISLSYLSKLKSFVFGLSIVGVFGFIYNDLNNILLSKWLSLSEFGLYSILLNTAVAFILITSTIKNSLFPNITESIHDELHNIQKQYQFHFNLMAYVCIPIAVFLFIHSYTILSFWFDTDIAEKLNLSLKFFAAGNLFYALMIIPVSYLIAHHLQKYLICSAGFLAIIAIPLLHFLVENFRFEGGSMFWFYINLIPCFFLIFYTQKVILKNMLFNFFDGIIFPLLITGSVYGLCYLVHQYIQFSLFPFLVFFSLASGIIFLTLYRKIQHYIK